MNLSHSRPIWRPFTQEKTAPIPVAIARAEGSYLYTDKEAKIFDGVSSWWLITHGHCHPRIVEAIQGQAARADQVLLANFTHQPAEELADLLVRLTPPSLTRVFFSDNGSTAVEVALKMALQARAQSGSPEKTLFLTFAGAYHGDTVGAMSLSARSQFSAPYRKVLFETIQAKHPTRSDASPEDFVQDFERLIQENHARLAGVIIEPLVQGAGGMIFWPDSALKRIAELCRRFGVFLIFDEVMTGFGRTGRLFAMDRLGVVPDLLCLSKGLTGGALPLAITMASETVYEAFNSHEKGRMLFHGHSFTGNPISCAAAVANLKIFMEERTEEMLPRIEEAHRKSLRRLQGRIPMSDPRVCGTIAAFEFCYGGSGYLSSFSGTVTREALRHGLFVRPLGSTVYLMPPFGSGTSDIEDSWSIMEEILKNMY